jgi:hypothetical protein
MRVKIDKRWKNDLTKKLEEKRAEVAKMRSEFIEGKCGDYALSGKIDFYENEIQYLEGKLSAISLIEEGCFYEIVSEDGKAYV